MSEKVFETPGSGDDERRVIAQIDDLRQQLRRRVSEPRRWLGGLRRTTLARAVQGSNSIEGYDASLDDVVAAVDGEEPLDANAETQLALEGYRDAMTYVLQVATDPGAEIDEGLLKALHFMMLKHDLTKNPGRWRPGAIYVRREPDGDVVYEGPDAGRIPQLIESVIDDLAKDDHPALVKAAMAHLNLVMVHPFSDGNGRMARCLQTLVLARERILTPAFSSIEEYLGRNTPAYYEALGTVGQGSWHPENNARPWVRFCLTAHLRQATTILRRIEESESIWAVCSELAEKAKLPERSVAGLWDAAVGLRVRNATYRRAVQLAVDQEITDLTASRDLRAIVEAGLFTPVGERRGRSYIASPVLRRVGDSIREARPPREDRDPFPASEQLSIEFTG